MINSQELAFSGFREALVESVPAAKAPKRAETTLWKALIVATTVLFIFVAAAKKEASDLNLTGRNLLRLANADRERQGIKPLRENAKLETAAQAKAYDILTNNYFAHTSPAGREPWDFIKSTGLRYAFAGENLALNYTSAYELEKDFLGSPSHRDNLLSPLFSDVGIAVVAGKSRGQNVIVTVQMFATPLETLANARLDPRPDSVEPGWTARLTARPAN